MSKTEHPIRHVQEQEIPPYDEEEFLSFVQKQIDDMIQYSKLGHDNVITFMELNTALCSYQKILLTLIGMYNMAKIEHLKDQERFDDWFAQKYLTIRAQENRPELSAQKWLAQKEIEYMVRERHLKDYREKKEKLLISERKVSFLKQLVDSWTSQQFILSTLSKNIQAEVIGLKNENGLTMNNMD